MISSRPTDARQRYGTELLAAALDRAEQVPVRHSRVTGATKE